MGKQSGHGGEIYCNRGSGRLGEDHPGPAAGGGAAGHGPAVAETAEPTSSTTGGLIRDALCGFTPRTGAEIAALFMADRVAHNVNPVWGIGRMLLEGKDVVCDRYYHIPPWPTRDR